MSSSNEKALKELIRSVEITRDARFQANLRLSDRQKTSNYVISFLSLSVIFLSLIPTFHATSNDENMVLLASSIIISVFIIFTSLIDGSSNFYHRGELLHRCARGAGKVLLKLKLPDPNDAKFTTEFTALRTKYQKVLDQCPVNHDNVDYRKARIQKPDHFIGRDYSSGEKKRWRQIQIDKCYHFIASRLWLLPHIVVVSIISFLTLFILRT